MRWARPCRSEPAPPGRGTPPTAVRGCPRPVSPRAGPVTPATSRVPVPRFRSRLGTAPGWVQRRPQGGVRRRAPRAAPRPPPRRPLPTASRRLDNVRLCDMRRGAGRGSRPRTTTVSQPVSQSRSCYLRLPLVLRRWRAWMSAYARVSTGGADPRPAAGRARKAGCGKVYEETASGAKAEPVVLARCSATCGRATPSSSGGSTAWALPRPPDRDRRALAERGIGFKSADRADRHHDPAAASSSSTSSAPWPSSSATWSGSAPTPGSPRPGPGAGRGPAEEAGRPQEAGPRARPLRRRAGRRRHHLRHARGLPGPPSTAPSRPPGDRTRWTDPDPAR
jgi:hypothetical protein